MRGPVENLIVSATVRESDSLWVMVTWSVGAKTYRWHLDGSLPLSEQWALRTLVKQLFGQFTETSNAGMRRICENWQDEVDRRLA
jgi:hypothetical protein